MPKPPASNLLREPPRVLFVSTSLGRAGAEAQVALLSSQLHARGWPVAVVSLVSGNAYSAELSGVHVETLDMPRGVPSPRGLFRLIRLIKRWQPSVIHSHMVHANLLTRTCRLITQWPLLICTAHNVHEGPRWRELAYRLSDPLCDLTTQVSHTGVKQYRERGVVPAHKLVFMPNAVDDHRFKPDRHLRENTRNALGANKRFVWLSVARFDPVKNHGLLLRAFAKASRQFDSTTLWLAGIGPERARIEAMATQLGLESKVAFLGLREDIPSLMNAADGFVLSSQWEGCPIVLLEASAVGVPIVATDVGGISEIVSPTTDHLVPPEDDETMASAMLSLMRLPYADRVQMGAQKRASVVTRFGIRSALDQWMRLYRDLLASRLPQ